ncbi:molybdopterin-dependent oxidoreductase [uncultured Pseudodesulfovibrio sp.]|uniref:molybdopterin-dependent oxidoreductase n=1 Tax=uncultured Pseudodesulfovibrio sp. TaxID=2035858 RepID=UPI0029C8C5D5|nr:molybdopterin-dependent oxidoreductase [uncultured Pseudodesulfovibrio sp.]
MKKLTACTMDCGDACSLLVDAEKKTVSGNPKHPFTKGFCCRKGARYFERLEADERITTPLVRQGSGFVEASWDEALGLVAQKLDAARQVPESILHVRGYGYRGILAQASSHFFQALGSSKTYGAVCDDTGITACIRDFGSLNHNDVDDLLNASRIVNWGKDMSRMSIHMQTIVQKARKNGTEVLSISPGGDGTPDFSDVHVLIRPGTDRFLAAAVLKLYFEAGDLNPWVVNRTSNWPALRGLIDSLDYRELCAACEVPSSDVEMIYDWYADTGNVATLIAWGLQRHVFGGQNVRFINALAMTSGHIGISGGGSYYNISSGRNLGKWDRLMKGGDMKADRRELLVHDLGREIRRAYPPVDFIWVDGHNIVNQIPDCLGVADAMRRPFVVCVDGFMNDTALVADVILPPALMFEREDVLGSFIHNCVNYCAPVVEPRGQCRPDFDILADLGGRLANPVQLPSAEVCLREGLKKKNISLDELRENGFVKVSHPYIAFEDMQFDHPDGKYRFPEAISPEPERDPEYPLQLLTLLRGKFLHSQIPESEQAGYPTVWISKKNPAFAMLNPAMDCYLVTEAGAMRVNVETDDTIHSRAVIIRRGGWLKFGHNANVLITPKSTDMADGCAYYSQTCRLENRS